jgi:GMP synthase-like glutamine amidotransferase
MRVHYLQHVPFETPEKIADWVQDNGFKLSGTLLYEHRQFPLQSEFDLLIVLGGPMSVHDEVDFPWLIQEKEFIDETIAHKKLVLGICLGAQLIAEVLGGKVYKNSYTEIGWFPVKMTAEARGTKFLRHLPQEYTPFHWHGETFHLPDAIKSAALSIGCANQAFEYQGHVVGLQFHLESSNASIERLINHCRDEMTAGEYIQQAPQMLDQTSLLRQSNDILEKLLDAMEESYPLSK